MNMIKKRAGLAVAIVLSMLLAGLAGNAGACAGAQPEAASPSMASEKGGSSEAREFAPWWNLDWLYRRPITINNANGGQELAGYQVWVTVPYDSDMKADFSDLRFAQYNESFGQSVELPYFVENRTNGSRADVWIKTDRIPAGSSAVIYMYYGNPSATSASNIVNTFEFYDDFEDGTLNKWSVFSGTGFSVDSTTFAPNKVMKIAAYTSGSEPKNAIISKGFAIANFTMEFKARDDGTDFGSLAWYDASSYFYLFYYHRDILRWTTSWATVKSGTDYTTTNTWMDIKLVGCNGTLTGYVGANLAVTNSSLSSYNGPVGFRKGSAGTDYVDEIRVRKYASPEPQASIGEEERPFTFKSFNFSPPKMNVGDTVFFNATFNNPTPDPIMVQLAARDADNFKDTTDYFYEEEVTLEPFSDSTFPFTWTAVGGPRTVWLAVFGYPYASAKIRVNRDPVLAPVKDQSLRQDRDFTLQVNASDPDGDTLTWSIDNPFLNISQVSNRSAQISCLPTNDDIGVHRANITVRDPMNRSDTRRINFTVNNVDDPPVIAKIPSLSATQYKELRYQAKASDPDIKWGDVLTFTDNTDLFEIDPKTGEFFFTPVEEQVGKHSVKITVTDVDGASDTVSFTITVANVNDPPTIEMLPPQFALQGRLFQLKVVATDPDMKSDPTEKLRFSDDSALFNINNDTGLISFTPTNDQIGGWVANITVTDKGGLSSTTPLTITVMNANDPPSLEAIPAQTATEGVAFQYQTSASDPDLKWGLDNLTFTDDTDLFNIDPKTGAIAFTPTSAQSGIKKVTITVKDEKGATASASFDLTVVHVNHPPYDTAIKYPLDGARLKEGDQMWLDGTAKDSDKGDTLEYSWLDNGEPAGTGKNISVKLKPGKHTITLEVSDGSEAVSTEISVEVEKKMTVTVTSAGYDWLPLAAAAAAAIAIVAVVAVLASKRRKRQQEPEPSGEGRVDSVPEEEGIALPPVPPAEAGPKGSGEEAQKVIDSTVDKLADYQEAHPDEALDIAPVMEKLNLARGLLESGECGDALDIATDAGAAVDRMLAPRRVAVKKRTVRRGGGALEASADASVPKPLRSPAEPVLRCEGCGEELQPGWASCPVCGRRP